MCTRLVVVATGLALFVPALQAQCPDGTPPPCEVRTAQVAQRRVQAPPLSERGRSFLVLPFRNVTRSADHDWLVEGATTLLSDALGQWEEISVVPSERLYPALRRHGLEPGQVMDEAAVREVAEETGGWTAITGDVLVTGSRIRLSARAYDVVSNEVLVRATENADGEDDILPGFERLAGQLLAAAGLEASAADLAGMGTQSLDAYRAYILGMGHYHRNEARQAREAFQEAVDLDSTFAQAHLKLAESLMTTVEAVHDPESEAYRHAQRAAALSQRLPARDRAFVQGIAALFQARLVEARERLSGILAADSNDLEALENLADIEMMDPVLVGMPSGERPRGSYNEAARLAKRALALDPGRHQNFETLTGVYLAAGGAGEFGYGRVVGIRGEPASLAGMIQQMALAPARLFVVVMRDTIDVVPVDSLEALEADTLAAARRRALQAAIAWVGQWLAATPDAALTNLRASEIYTHAGLYDLALAHLARADSVGVEIDFLQNLPGRRLQILFRAGRHEEAVALADSLRSGDYFEASALVRSTLRQIDIGWVLHSYFLAGRPAAAESAVVLLRDAVLEAVPQAPEGELTSGLVDVLMRRTDAQAPLLLPEIPEEMRFASADSLIAHLDELDEGGLLDSRLLIALPPVVEGLPAARMAPVLARWRAGARRWVEESRGDLAIKVLATLVSLDSSETGRDEVHALLLQVTEDEPELWIAQYQLGELGAVSGMFLDDAEAALRRYLEHDPAEGENSKASALWRLGMVYEHKSDIPAARAAYEEALRLEPEHPQATAALQRLEGGDDSK